MGSSGHGRREPRANWLPLGVGAIRYGPGGAFLSTVPRAAARRHGPVGAFLSTVSRAAARRHGPVGAFLSTVPRAAAMRHGPVGEEQRTGIWDVTYSGSIR